MATPRETAATTLNPLTPLAELVPQLLGLLERESALITEGEVSTLEPLLQDKRSLLGRLQQLREHWLREAQRASLGPRAFLHRQLGAGLAGQLEQQFQQLRQLNQRNATALALRRRQAEQGLHHLLGQRSPSPASAYGRGGQLQWQAGPRVLGVS